MQLREKAGAYLILALCVLLPYARIYTLGFTNFDDPGYVTQNAHVRAGVTWSGLLWALKSTEQSNWHPVTWISHMLDCQVFGLNAAGHHVTNLLLHLAATLLLFTVFRRMTGAVWRSTLLAALFAVHPLHVESVAWVAERKDVLSAVFWMLTMHAYVRYAKGGRRLHYLEMVMWLALGLASKPMLVTLPPALLLLDVWPLERMLIPGPRGRSRAANWRSRLNCTVFIEKIPLLVLCAASSVITYLAQQHGGSVVSLHFLPLYSRVANAVLAYATYVRKALWPSGLAAFYPRPGSLDYLSLTLSFILLAFVSILAFALWRKRPYLAIGWLWFLGTLVPVIGLVQVGNQALANRYTYIPLIGLLLMAVWAGADFLERFKIPRFDYAAAGFALICCLGILTWRETGYWKNSVTLFSRTIELTGDNELAYLDYGAALASEGRLEEAVKLYEGLVGRAPNLPDIQTNLGMILELQGKNAAAIPHFNEALRADPEHPEAHNGLGAALEAGGRLQEAEAHFLEALRVRPDFPEARYNLGCVLAAQGKLQLAAGQLREALRLRPNYPEAHEKIALVLAGLGELEEALPHYEAAAHDSPQNPEFHFRFGLALYRHHQLSDARLQLQEAVRLRPEWPDALNNLAWIMASSENTTKADSEQAVALAEKALRLAEKPDASLFDTLAEAYASSGRFPEAVKTAEAAAGLAIAAGDKPLAAEIERRCQLYRSGRSYREDGR